MNGNVNEKKVKGNMCVWLVVALLGIGVLLQVYLVLLTQIYIQ